MISDIPTTDSLFGHLILLCNKGSQINVRIKLNISGTWHLWYLTNAEYEHIFSSEHCWYLPSSELLTSVMFCIGINYPADEGFGDGNAVDADLPAYKPPASAVAVCPF